MSYRRETEAAHPLRAIITRVSSVHHHASHQYWSLDPFFDVTLLIDIECRSFAVITHMHLTRLDSISM